MSKRWKMAIVSTLVVSLAVTVHLYTRTVYEPFLVETDSVKMSAIQNYFDSNQIKYEIRDNATSIWVSKKQFNDARLLYATDPNQEFYDKEQARADLIKHFEDLLDVTITVTARNEKELSN